LETAHSVAIPNLPPGTPVYHFTDKGGSTESVTAPQAQSLPFHYTFDVQYTLDSRVFNPVNGKACVNAQVNSGRGETMTITMFESEWWGWGQVGNPINYPTNGGYNGYCWGALSNEAFFRITHVTGGSAVAGEGDVVPN
jgi:hypothetical protein